MTVPKRSGGPVRTNKVAGPMPRGPGQTPADRLPVHPRPFGVERTGETVETLREVRAELADLAAWLRR